MASQQTRRKRLIKGITFTRTNQSFFHESRICHLAYYFQTGWLIYIDSEEE